MKELRAQLLVHAGIGAVVGAGAAPTAGAAPADVGDERRPAARK